MSVLPIGISGEQQYQISRSLRFNSADSAYLNRTPTSNSTSQTTRTFSVWLKRSALNSSGRVDLFYQGVSAGSGQMLYIHFSSDAISVWYDGTPTYALTTSAVFRDVSAWYHIVISSDTTQATAANRTKIYVNGIQQTITGTQPTQNYTAVNGTTSVNYIGGNFAYFNGYMTEINFIDGQALAPTDLGETNPTTGVWQPKKYTGTYGTNGFYLNFSDNSGTTSTTLGKDYSGNGNNWTPNNFSVTAGAGNDSLVDSPTRYGTDTGLGGQVRGNYCTLNPLITGNVIPTVNGNLQASLASGSNAYFSSVGTIAIATGKWYWECVIDARDASAAQWLQFGIVSSTTTYTSNAIGYSGNMSAAYAYYNDGNKAGNGTGGTAYGATFTTNDVIGVAFDADAGTITFYKNGVSQGQAFSGISTSLSWYPIIQIYRSTGTNQSATINLGQRPFAYTAPSGFKALVTTNLPTPTIADGSEYFAVNTRVGTGTSSGSITGLSFQPDFLWTKGRNFAVDNYLEDAVRGVGKYLISNKTDAEATSSTFITAFNSDGVSWSADYANSSQTVVDWLWKAGGSGVTNTAGTITSTVSVNTTSGFSIVTYTGTGANATVGHGLGVAPSMVIVKNRQTAGNSWAVYHASIGNTNYLLLDGTAASASASNAWNNTSPTTTVFSVGSGTGVNESTKNFVAYCFAPVAGYSAFGAYTGNGSTDGPFVYTGFRPRYIMQKRTDSTGTWELYDTARDTYNVMSADLAANLSDAETTIARFDSLSNGFKIRTTGAATNASGGTYIYMAFAENPFSIALAR